MRNFLRLATGVNVAPLMLAIARQPELWAEDTFLRNYPQGPFGEVESIMLRFPAVATGLAEEEIALYKQNQLPGYDQHESVTRPAYAALPEARPLVMNLFAAVAGTRLGRVMINKIAPGGHIYAHCDTPEHCRYYKRYHIVLQSEPGVEFRCGDEKTYWEAGSAFFFRNELEHEIWNHSETDRIHLVMDAHHEELP
jgi:Aspartyl/Asparaginyl beta-hydroxylase